MHTLVALEIARPNRMTEIAPVAACAPVVGQMQLAHEVFETGQASHVLFERQPQCKRQELAAGFVVARRAARQLQRHNPYLRDELRSVTVRSLGVKIEYRDWPAVQIKNRVSYSCV